MQSPGREGEGEEGGEETLRPEGRDSKQQDGSEEEDCGANEPPVQKVRNQHESSCFFACVLFLQFLLFYQLPIEKCEYLLHRLSRCCDVALLAFIVGCT